jgi:hypothetical protein
MKFKGIIHTDGVGVSILKQNYEPWRRRSGNGDITVSDYCEEASKTKFI